VNEFAVDRTFSDENLAVSMRNARGPEEIDRYCAAIQKPIRKGIFDQ
jgi:hypothetical protein